MVSNPLKKRTSLEGLEMISVPVAKPAVEESHDVRRAKKDLDELIKAPLKEEQTDISSLISTINNFNTSKTKPQSYVNNYVTDAIAINSSINHFEIMRAISESFQNTKSVSDLISSLNNIFLNKLKWNFVGFGMFHEKSKCINLKLYTNSSNTYSSKVFLSDDKNPIVECFKNKAIIDKDNINYLDIPYLMKTSSVDRKSVV